MNVGHGWVVVMIAEHQCRRRELHEICIGIDVKRGKNMTFRLHLGQSRMKTADAAKEL